MLPQDIVLGPVITEKSMSGVENKKYTFKVAKNAGKPQIKRAVEQLFSVDVAKVNTVSVRGQSRRMGRHEGYTPSWKKAIVTLTAKSKSIEFFDGLK